MAPLLVSALLGIGAKIIGDLFMSGAKTVMKSKDASASGEASFAKTLDKARTPDSASAMTAKAGTTAFDAGFGDRSRVMAADASGAATTGARVQGLATYRRFDEVQAP